MKHGGLKTLVKRNKNLASLITEFRDQKKVLNVKGLTLLMLHSGVSVIFICSTRKYWRQQQKLSVRTLYTYYQAVLSSLINIVVNMCSVINDEINTGCISVAVENPSKKNIVIFDWKFGHKILLCLARLLRY